jgi:dephospho-CoA kinase
VQKIGLTGGIGSGKTTVAKLFEMLGIPLFYADLEAHRIRSRSEISEQIILQFGTKILVEELYELTNVKVIDNRKLADVIFNDETALRWINDLLHPLVIAEFDEWCKNVETHNGEALNGVNCASLSQNKIPFVVMESALIFEAKFEHLFDKIIVVDAPEDLRIERVMNRENISKVEVLQRVSTQLSADEKLKKADIIIQNDEQHSLIDQTMRLMQQISKSTNHK